MFGTRIKVDVVGTRRADGRVPNCLFWVLGGGMLRKMLGWGGVGGGVGMMTFLALAHMVDATQVMGWVGDDDVPCACTHGRCYASHGSGWAGGWGGDDDVPCTCTHGRCYASHGVGWG